MKKYSCHARKLQNKKIQLKLRIIFLSSLIRSVLLYAVEAITCHISTNTKTRIGLRGASETDGTERFLKNGQLPQIQIEQPQNTRDHQNNGNHGACEEKTGQVYWPPNPSPEQSFHQAVTIQRKCTETSWKTSTKNDRHRIELCQPRM